MSASEFGDGDELVAWVSLIEDPSRRVGDGGGSIVGMVVSDIVNPGDKAGVEKLGSYFPECLCEGQVEGHGGEIVEKNHRLIF